MLGLKFVAFWLIKEGFRATGRQGSIVSLGPQFSIVVRVSSRTRLWAQGNEFLAPGAMAKMTSSSFGTLIKLTPAWPLHNLFSPQENERVWYELSLLRTIYSQTHSAARMVCIVLPQKVAIDPHDLPLWAELKYRWPEDKRKILNRLNDRPFILPL